MAVMLLFSGNANIPLAKKIANSLGTTLGLASISKYSDDESKIEILQDVKNQDVFIIQPTSYPVNCNILELCLLAHTLKTKAARSITAVIPYFGYGRHDGDYDNGPSNAKLILQLLAAAGINQVLTLDLHSKRLQNFSDLTLKNISAAPLFVNVPQIAQLQDPIVVAADLGGITRAREFAKSLGTTNIAIINKTRYNKNKTGIAAIIGNIVNRNCIIVDDIIDTGNTIYAAARALRQQGSKQIYACCTHAVLSADAIQLLQQSSCDQIFVTDSISAAIRLNVIPKLNYISAANLLAAAIIRLTDN